MLNLVRSLLVAAVAAVLFVAIPASAAPITYGWTAGTITIQARQTTDNQLVVDETLPLLSDAFMVWDPDGTPSGFGLGTLDDFLFRIEPNQGPFATLISYGQYNMFTVDSGDIKPDFTAGYDTLVSFGGSITVGQIDIAAFYTASNSGGFPPPTPSTEADITGVTNMTGGVTFGPGATTIQIAATGVAMGTIDGTPFGEAGNDLELVANINFFGSSNVVPTPEPSTGLTVGLGLVGLAATRQRRRR